MHLTPSPEPWRDLKLPRRRVDSRVYCVTTRLGLIAYKATSQLNRDSASTWRSSGAFALGITDSSSPGHRTNRVYYVLYGRQTRTVKSPLGVGRPFQNT